MSAPLPDIRDAVIAVVGLGYVGLPLAVEFGRAREVIGYDIDSARVKELKDGRDHTLEVPAPELAAASGLRFTDDPADLSAAGVYIVTTPTPIDEHKQPDLTPVLSATEAIARTLQAALLMSQKVEPLERRLRVEGVKTGRIRSLDAAGQIAEGLALGLVSGEEAALLLDYDRRIMNIIHVDDFAPAELPAGRD